MLSRANLVLFPMAVMFATSALACASAHAKSPPETPPLEMPAPPTRIVDSPDSEQPQPLGLMDEPARHTEPATLRRQPTSPPRQDSTRQEPPKPESTPPPPPAESAKPAEDGPKPPMTLQMPPAGNEADVDRNIRALLARAMADLNRIDGRTLNADARTQYDTARGFIRQAEQALAEKNVVFAKSLAEKAAALAAQLAGR